MIDEGIASRKYVETNDTTHTDLERFQDFLYRHFKNKKCYDEMRPVLNQPARLFATTKAHKFKSLEEINVDQLKLRPIIDQTGTYTYNASRVIAKYVKALGKNEFTISDTLTFPDLVKNASFSNENEDVSYDVESLFKSIPVEEAINNMVDRIYVRKEIEPLCKKSIFKKLLFKLTKGCAFSVTGKLLKQVDGCPIGGPISVVFSDIFICNIEFDLVVPANKPVYLGLLILEISKKLMYEFWYDYIKPKYQMNAKLCYMDTDSFIIDIKTEDVYKDIANDAEKRFHTSNYEINRPLPTGKNKKSNRINER